MEPAVWGLTLSFGNGANASAISLWSLLEVVLEVGDGGSSGGVCGVVAGWRFGAGAGWRAAAGWRPLTPAWGCSLKRVAPLLAKVQKTQNLRIHNIHAS